MSESETIASWRAEDQRIRELAEQAGVNERSMRVILTALRLGAALSEQGHPESRVTAIVGAFATAQLSKQSPADLARSVNEVLGQRMTGRSF